MKHPSVRKVLEVLRQDVADDFCVHYQKLWVDDGVEASKSLVLFLQREVCFGCDLRNGFLAYVEVSEWKGRFQGNWDVSPLPVLVGPLEVGVDDGAESYYYPEKVQQNVVCD